MSFSLDKRTSSLIETAYLENMWKRVGYNNYDRCVILRGDVVKPIITDKKYWKTSYITNWLIMSSIHLNADTFSLFYNKIVSFKPKFIIAYPFNAYLLAKFIEEHKLQPITSLKAIICSSENMYDWQRKYMEDIYKVKIFSYYGLSEKCIIATECLDSTNYEFYPQYGFTELINKKNNWCTEENERGEIIATGFNNYASPFIRYKTDDIGIFTKNQSIDNPNWFTIKKIEGRKQDYVVDKKGTSKTAIHLDRPFWKIRDMIYAYQYLQNTRGKIELNIHPKNKLTQEQIDTIRKIFIKNYLNIDIEINEVNNIYRTKTGKFRYLIQKIKNI